MASRRPPFPAPAVLWLTAPQPTRVLIVGAGGGYPLLFADAGHHVTVVDREIDKVRRLLDRRPDIVGVVAQAEALPFEPCQFDHVVTIQNLHTVAPGLALSEFARVLDTGGTLSVAYLGRDDSVPWVKRLTAVVQASLPTAMRGAYGSDSIEAVEASAYFPRLETQHYRLWVPAARPDLVAMALAADRSEELTHAESSALAEAVGGIYDSTARPPEPLLLPYRFTCWRATVDHTELTAPIERLDDALHIIF